MRKFTLLAMTILILGMSSCARWSNPFPKHYQTTAGIVSGDVTSAEIHFQEAIRFLDASNLCGAEQALHQALICDDTFGPAHNALGKIYFDQKKYYLAAWEFEHANQLMPERPEPLNNLGLVYESVGQLDKSADYFSQAMAIDESNPEFLGNYLRARIRRGDDSSDLYVLLERLALIDDRPQWREWARRQLMLGEIQAPNVEEMLPYEEQHIPFSNAPSESGSTILPSENDGTLPAPENIK